jgi:hypothetical protein
MANLNFMSNKLFQYEAYPVLLSCNFVVDPANGNGLGLRNLKGAGIANAYMHTTSTPASGNPNPASGLIMVQLTQPYNRYLGGFSGFVSPLNGTNSTSTTANVANVITVLGTATLAQFQAVGLPKGVTPAIGVGFIATSSAVIGGGAEVQLAATSGSGITNIEVIGDPNATISMPVPLQPGQVQPVGPSAGGYILLRCMDAGTLTAPATGSVCSLSFYLSNSSILTNGQ